MDLYLMGNRDVTQANGERRAGVYFVRVAVDGRLIGNRQLVVLR
jgi:hypothetical protein